MLFVVKGDVIKEEEEIEAIGELGDALLKEAELSHKLVPIPRPPPPFPQRVVKKTQDGKYSRFIIMFK